MHQSGDHPRRPSPVCIPVCIPAQLRHPFRSSSSVKSYLRYNLTADSRTSLVPAIFHFYFHFYYFHSISFHIDVREIYEVQCVLYDTLRPAPNLSNIHIIFYIFHHFLTILHSSVIHPVYFFCVFLLCIQACIQACIQVCIQVCIPAPIPFYIFGPILPSVQSYRGF